MSGEKILSGQTALVTGGAKRLGRASAMALAEAGADVAITFLDSVREAQRTVVDLGGLGEAFGFSQVTKYFEAFNLHKSNEYKMP